ncbi:MAG: hypothetical protein R2875_08010 [Desulfobacterales bacterium]
MAICFGAGLSNPGHLPIRPGIGGRGFENPHPIRETFDHPTVVTEVMDLACFDMVEAYADIIQIGTPEHAELQPAPPGRAERKSPVF